ncbi:hypothetical protein BS47DRAFT_1295346, partial [Hydnum rufescens UP504]
WNMILPQLVTPYAKLMSATSNGQHPVPTFHSSCTKTNCNGPSRQKLKVTCVYTKYLKEIYLDVCKCCPASLQLLERGLFPSAPVQPTLAVDLDQLNIVSMLFMVSAPNVMNWAKTLMLCLARKGYVLGGQDVLHHHYGQALQYYQVMIDMVSQTVNNMIESSRKHQAQGEHAVIPQTFESLAGNPITRSYFTQDEDQKPSHDRKCLSPYLRS